MAYTPYEIVKWWLPIISAFGLVIKGWNTGKRMVTGWVDKLLNNHLRHIEQNTAETASVMRAGFEEQALSFQGLGSFMHSHSEMDAKVQQAILTNLEILKDRSS